MSMVSILAALCTAFLLILLILLIVPINLSFELCKNGQLIRGSYKISWFGLVLKKEEILPASMEDLSSRIFKNEDDHEAGGLARESKIFNERGNDDSRKEGSKKNEKPGSLETLKIKSFVNAFPAIIMFLRNLLKSITFHELTCKLSIGLDDPVQTALISGHFWSISSMLGLFQTNLLFEPCFDEERLDGRLSALLSVRLLWTVVALANALREREMRTLLKEISGWT